MYTCLISVFMNNKRAIYKFWTNYITLADTTFIPMGVMYLHTWMFCILPHTSSIPMCAINFYMQEHFLHSLIPLLFPCLRCIYTQEYSVHLFECQSFKTIACRPSNILSITSISHEPVLRSFISICVIVSVDFLNIL